MRRQMRSALIISSKQVTGELRRQYWNTPTIIFCLRCCCRSNNLVEFRNRWGPLIIGSSAVFVVLQVLNSQLNAGLIRTKSQSKITKKGNVSESKEIINDSRDDLILVSRVTNQPFMVTRLVTSATGRSLQTMLSLLIFQATKTGTNKIFEKSPQPGPYPTGW